MSRSLPSLLRLQPRQSLLVVIDVQEKLLAKIPRAQPLVRNIAFLLDAARLLEVPVLATEQYPQGLGPTTPELARRLPDQLPAKKCFSSCGSKTFHDKLQATQRRQLILTGMETHVCVQQTALDLLASAGEEPSSPFEIIIPVDAVAARRELDHDVALRRLERVGATLTTCESIVFEWLGSADHPAFKAISQLVKERDVDL